MVFKGTKKTNFGEIEEIFKEKAEEIIDKFLKDERITTFTIQPEYIDNHIKTHYLRLIHEDEILEDPNQCRHNEKANFIVSKCYDSGALDYHAKMRLICANEIYNIYEIFRFDILVILAMAIKAGWNDNRLNDSSIDKKLKEENKKLKQSLGMTVEVLACNC